VEDALYSAYGQRQISTIYAPEDQYHVILELLPDEQRDPAAMATIYVHSSQGGPLSGAGQLCRSARWPR